MDKVYFLKNCSIKVSIEIGIIHIYSDEGLWDYLTIEQEKRSLDLIYAIKSDYKTEFNQRFKITDDSLAVEIGLHIFCHYYGLKIQRKTNIKWVKRLVEKGIERAEVIDCGEKNKDRNRWVWDMLSHIKSFAFWLLPKNINGQMLKN